MSSPPVFATLSWEVAWNLEPYSNWFGGTAAAADSRETPFGSQPEGILRRGAYDMAAERYTE
jgi:hypothetical protein